LATEEVEDEKASLQSKRRWKLVLDALKRWENRLAALPLF
jgi:hypothetical protein